jgi:probable HAF family extracellular repeat protein
MITNQTLTIHRRRETARPAFAWLILLLCHQPASAASFEILGFTTPWADKPVFMSDDGSVVVVQTDFPTNGYVWKSGQGIVHTYGYLDLYPTAISGDGNHIFGSTLNSTRNITDSSFDGSITVENGTENYLDYYAYHNVAGGPLTDIGDLPGGARSTFASAVSADGSTAVGTSTNSDGYKAVRWTAATGLVDLGVFPSIVEPRDRASDVSADGAVVVGRARTSEVDYRAFRWTSQTGMQNIDTLLNSRNSDAIAVSADGTTIVGGALLPNFNNFSATIWDEAHGMRLLADVLTLEFGLDLQGVEMWTAMAVSADGNVFAGRGIKNFDGNNQTVAWRVDLNPIPEPHSLALVLLATTVLPHRRRANGTRS